MKDDEAVKKFSDEARTYFNKYQDLRYEREKLPTSERYYTYEYMGGTSAPRRMEWTRSKKQIEENKRKNDSLIQKRENERRELDETLQGIRRLNAA